MREVPLTRGFVALVDDEDFNLVNRHKWQADRDNKRERTFRAVTSVRVNGKKKKLYMHRLIWGTTENVQVDHINRNPLDNRRSNLRAATRTQNNHNRAPVHGSKVSYKGVCLHNSRRSPFQANITANGKRHYIGSFAVAEDAAKAYDKKASALFGEFAYLNFPESASA